MADESTATEGAGTSEQPSDLSKPVGINDSATFDKFFGKDSKLWDGDKPKESKPKAGDKEPKKPAAESKPAPKESSPKEKPEPKGAKSSEKTPGDSAKDKAPKAEKPKPETDPSDDDDAAPAKAKELYAKAKAATDTREGRKLYRQAMKEAFGEVPDEFNDQKWAAARQKREADAGTIAKKEQAFQKNVDAAVTRLTPAINVMKRLQAANLVEKLDGATVDRAIDVMRAIRELEDGDFTSLSRIVEKASGKPTEEAMKLFVRGVKASPEGRAARQAAESALREAQEAKAQLAEYKRQLEVERTERATQQTKADRAAEQAQARTNYLASIETELEGHPVLKLPRGKERVMAYLVKTANPQTRAPRYTKERVADIIVENERKRLAAARDVLEPGEEPAPVQRLRTPSRSETAEPGHVPESPEASFERIWARRSAGGRR